MSRFTVRIVGGGDPGPTGMTAIEEAVGRVLRRDERGEDTHRSVWARAGRLEATGAVRISSRSRLTGD